MHLVFGEEQAHRGLVGPQPLFHLGDGESFASRTALVQAEIAVGVKLALVPEHADLVVADEDDRRSPSLNSESFATNFSAICLTPSRFTLGLTLQGVIWDLLGCADCRVRRPDTTPTLQAVLLAQTGAMRDHGMPALNFLVPF
jgi:hypothetical protein